MRSVHVRSGETVNGVVRMNELGEFLKRLEDLTNRRCWLLYEALRCVPLDRAIALARSAEAFVSGSAVEDRLQHDQIGAEGAAMEQPAPDGDPINAESSSLPTIGNGLALTSEQREQLLDRLARGSRNAELASEFGLSAKQVQGIRMGSAREIAMRRDRHSQTDSVCPAAARDPVSAEDVVRYLRRQDDVVVPHGDGVFLVNARFRLGLAELIDRANKMRRRQDKPEFQLAGGQALKAQRLSSANGHPMFWEQRPAASSRSAGFIHLSAKRLGPTGA